MALLEIATTSTEMPALTGLGLDPLLVGTHMTYDPQFENRQPFANFIQGNVDMRGADSLFKTGGYYEKASEKFKELFGDADKNYECTAETVSDAVQRLRIDGKSYADRFNLPDIDENNFRFVVCQVMENLTRGSIAQSFYNSRSPMKVTLTSGNSGAPAPVQAVIPPEPAVREEPVEPQGPGWFKRFMHRFGMFKQDFQQYDEAKQRYSEQKALYEQEVNKKAAYEANKPKAENEAKRVAGIVEARMQPDAARRQLVEQTLQDPQKRSELHSAAKEMMGKIPFESNDKVNATLAQFFEGYHPATVEEIQLPDGPERQQVMAQRNQLTVRCGLQGMGRPSSVLTDLMAYAMTYGGADGKGMTLEQLLDTINDPSKSDVLKTIGKNFADDFSITFQPVGTTLPEVKSEDISEEKRNRMADRMTGMFKTLGEQRLEHFDPLNVTDIREKGGHNYVVARMGMDLGQMLGGGSSLCKDIFSRIDNRLRAEHLSPLSERKAQASAAKTIGDAATAVGEVFAKDDFQSGTLHPAPRGTRQQQADIRPGHMVSALYYPEDLGQLQGKKVSELTSSEIWYGNTAATKLIQNPEKMMYDVLNQGAPLTVTNFTLNFANIKTREVAKTADFAPTNINNLVQQEPTARRQSGHQRSRSNSLTQEGRNLGTQQRTTRAMGG